MLRGASISASAAQPVRLWVPAACVLAYRSLAVPQCHLGHVLGQGAEHAGEGRTGDAQADGVVLRRADGRLPLVALEQGQLAKKVSGCQPAGHLTPTGLGALDLALLDNVKVVALVTCASEAIVPRKGGVGL